MREDAEGRATGPSVFSRGRRPGGVSRICDGAYNVGLPPPERRHPMALNPYDLYDVRSLLSEEERAVQDTVARFTDERVIPIIGECFDEGRFPRELVAEIAEMGLLGSSLPEKYGCAGLNAVSYGPDLPGTRARRQRHPQLRLGAELAVHVPDLRLRFGRTAHALAADMAAAR